MNGERVITVHGLPAPQGSKRHVGHGRLVEMSRRVGPWRQAVAAAALAGAEPSHVPLTAPVAVEVTFSLPRPAVHFRGGRYAHLLRPTAPAVPARQPDLDKLLRSTLDGLTTGQVWADDALVCEATARKLYVGGGIDALERPGALIRVAVLPAAVGGAA